MWLFCQATRRGKKVMFSARQLNFSIFFLFQRTQLKTEKIQTVLAGKSLPQSKDRDYSCPLIWKDG